jgi:hypothetical protein
MASHETHAQKETVERVMRAFKHGELDSSRGGKVKSRKQAVAIALSEAGASNQQTPAENKRQLSRSKTKERKGETSQAEAEGKSSAKSSAKPKAPSHRRTSA